MTGLRITAIVLGIILIAFAALAFVVDVIAFIDPVGAKGADDNDPFGPPPSRRAIALQGLVTLGVGGLGVWLVVHHARRIRNAV